MAKKFGGIELGGTLGGYEILGIPASKLPQDAASAIGVANSDILGATFSPIFYVGKQLVNGVNHLFIAEEIRVTKATSKYIVGLVVNVPPGANADKGEGAKIVKIIQGENLAEEVQAAFDTVEKGLVGVGYEPIMYIGKQLVKGENHYIVCEAKTIYPGAEPYAAVMCINIFEGKASLVGVAPLNAGDTLCGYAFTW